MALDDIVRSSVALANRITVSLQDEVTYEAWTGSDEYNNPTYAAAVSLPALIEWKQTLVRTVTGQEAVSRSKITFLYPVAFDERDRLTLPDGTTGPILDMTGFVDPDTGNSYFTEVWLG